MSEFWVGFIAAMAILAPLGFGLFWIGRATEYRWMLSRYDVYEKQRIEQVDP